MEDKDFGIAMDTSTTEAMFAEVAESRCGGMFALVGEYLEDGESRYDIVSTYDIADMIGWLNSVNTDDYVDLELFEPQAEDIVFASAEDAYAHIERETSRRLQYRMPLVQHPYSYDLEHVEDDGEEYIVVHEVIPGEDELDDEED